MAGRGGAERGELGAGASPADGRGAGTGASPGKQTAEQRQRENRLLRPGVREWWWRFEESEDEYEQREHALVQIQQRQAGLIAAWEEMRRGNAQAHRAVVAEAQRDLAEQDYDYAAWLSERNYQASERLMRRLDGRWQRQLDAEAERRRHAERRSAELENRVATLLREKRQWKREWEREAFAAQEARRGAAAARAAVLAALAASPAAVVE